MSYSFIAKKIFMGFVFGMLNYPIKFQKHIPNNLIYTVKKPLRSGVIRYYSKLIDLQHGRLLAYMNTERELIPKENAIVPSLYVDIIKSVYKNKGYGTQLMNYAKTLSKKLGCNGNIHLIACNEFDSKRAPHIFYKKWGMNTGDYFIDSKIDNFIQRNKKTQKDDFPNIEMYYPPVKYDIDPDIIYFEQKEGFWKSLFKKFFPLK